MMRSTSRVPGTLIVWMASYLFFILTLVNNFSAAHDSIHYLNDIVKSQNLFHQHHLLYHFLANKWLTFWTGYFNCGVHAGDGLLYCRPHYIIESFTALWGSSALTIIYLFFRNRFFLTRAACMLGTSVIACSYGVWFYSVNIEVYMPPIFFILWCLYVLTEREFRQKDIWKVAVLHSLAILFHQANVLFIPVVIYVLIKNRMPSSILKYGLTGLLITGGTYFLIGWTVLGNNSWGTLVQWVQGYTVGHDYWQPLSAKTPLHALTGFSHAFVGGHFIFQISVVEQYLQQSFQAHGLKDETFLAAGVSSKIAWVLAASACIVALVLCILFIKFIARFPQMKMHSRVIHPLLLCLLIYSVFFCFWMPEILEFWILQMIIVWLLLLGMLPLIKFPFRIGQNIGLTILLLLMFSVNFFGSMRWMQKSKNDWYHVETQKVLSSVRKGDIIVVENEWVMKDYLRYYTPAIIIATDEPLYNKVEADKMIAKALSEKGIVYYYRDNKLIQAY